MAEKVLIFDTTLRDGEQAGHKMFPDTKLAIAQRMADAGVDIIEAGFPISSEGDARAVKLIAKNVVDPVICALARTKQEDIEAAARAIECAKKPRIHVFVATSDVHVERKLKKSKAEIIDMVVSDVRRAKQYCQDIEFSPEDASRTSWQYLADVIKAAIDAGAGTINIPDTTGYAIPWEFEKQIRWLYQEVPQLRTVTLSVHCHNDLELAPANTLAGIRAGARQIEGCFLGIGERAGNVKCESVIAAIMVRGKDLGDVYTDFQTAKLGPLCRFNSRHIGYPILAHHPVVGSMAFRHSAGVHEDGVLKERTTYEIMKPEDVGWEGEEVRLVSHGGRSGLRARLDTLGYQGSEIVEEVYVLFIKLSDEKGVLGEEDLHMLAQEVLIRRIAKKESLFYFEDARRDLQYGPGFAAARIFKNGTSYREAACGDGPIDALCKAIFRAVEKHDSALSALELCEDIRFEKGRGGSEANAWVEVPLRLANKEGYARSADPDTVLAAGKACLYAINHVLHVPVSKAGTP